MKKILLPFLFVFVCIMQACDKVDAPYAESGSGNGGTNSVTINNTNITGSIIDYSVSGATESDTSELTASWYYQVSGDTAFASIIFTWHGIKSDSLTGLITPQGSVHFDDTLAIPAGSPNGTLTFHYIADIGSSGTGSATVIVIIVNAQASRKILLLDFTGHHCIFCPRAARTTTQLEAIYGDQIVPIAVHCGSFADTTFSYPWYSYDFRTPEGNQLKNDYGINAFPNGSINLKTFGGNFLVPYTSWGSTISNLLKVAPEADIQVTNTYNGATRQVTASVKTDFLKASSGNFYLAVYLTEDSIINYQYDFDATPNDVPDYVHMHALRTSFSGTYGEQIATDPALNTSVTKSYNLTLKSDFNEYHCHVVAFVYNNSLNKEVVQAGQAKVTP